MLYLLNPRVIALLVVLAALAASHVFAYRKGSSHVRLEWTAATARANADARALEQQRQRRADEAGALAATREAGLRAAAVRAAGAAGGLRDELGTLRLRSAQSLDAANKRTAAIGELLGQCADEYRSLAERADRHVNDVRLLQDAWPK